MKLYLILAGASKHSSALLCPCGSYKFIYDPVMNAHLLEGGPLTPDRFNEVAADLARRFDPSDTHLRIVPRIVLEPVPPQSITVDASPGWEQERAQLLRDLDAAEQLIGELQARPLAKASRRLVKPTNV